MVTLTVLGSGTFLPDAGRTSAAHLVEGAGFRLLLDCGPGTLHGFDRHGIDWRGITHIALSHFHADHVGDVYPLLFALTHGSRPPRERPLTVLGPPGVRRFLEQHDRAYGSHAPEPPFPVDVVQVEGSGRWLDAAGRFALGFHPTPHTDVSVCYRVEAEGRSVGYSGDTGPSPDVAAFLAGCDVLVCECALADPPEIDTHLSPRGVAELARVARPGRLLLTHQYPPLEPHRTPDLVAGAGYEGAVDVARDGLRVELGDDPRGVDRPRPGG